MDEKQTETLQEKIKALLKKPFLKRAKRTFLQAFGGYIASVLVDVISGIDSWNAAKIALSTLFASAVAAGIAAVMNRNELTVEEIKAQAVAERAATVSTEDVTGVANSDNGGGI
jgi:hypothetical protein